MQTETEKRQNQKNNENGSMPCQPPVALIMNLSDSSARQFRATRASGRVLSLNVHPTGRARMVTFAQNSGGAVAKVNLMSKKQRRIINNNRRAGIGGYRFRQL